MQTALTDLLKIDYPIIQGAMAWLADADLASAVSEAGGLGVIGTATYTAEEAIDQIKKARQQTSKPLAVNLMLMSPNVDALVDYLVESSDIKIVTTGAGNPGPYMDRLHQAGIKVIPVVASVALAKRMDRMEADAIIVEGMEAGGHIGRTTSLSLLPQVVDAVDCPVIAAGGFGDGRSLAAAFMLGACGVQVGTRFAVAHECNAHPDFKRAIIKATDISTTVTGQITGHPIRVLRNNLTKQYLAVEKSLTSQETPDLTSLDQLAQGSLKRAVKEGDAKNGSVMAGQIAGLIDKEKSAADIIQSFVVGAKETYDKQRHMFND